jgi:hypothetical protein
MKMLKIFKNNKSFFISNSFLFFVLFVFIFSAYFNTSFAAETFKQMVERLISSVKQPIISLFGTLAVATFMFGVVKYMKGGEIQKEGAKNLMVWGLVGLAVMSAVWGFVYALKSTLGI